MIVVEFFIQNYYFELTFITSLNFVWIYDFEEKEFFKFNYLKRKIQDFYLFPLSRENL